MAKGWIYALETAVEPVIKIGLTTTSPAQRIRELNSSLPYKLLGPWRQIEIRQVKDVRTVETILHRQLAGKRYEGLATATELFEIDVFKAREILDSIPDAELLAPVPINRLKLDRDFISYLLTLFRSSGLENFRDIEESWIFSLFPSTAGGRFFTLSIDRHEVAYCQPIAPPEKDLGFHSLVVDRLVERDCATKEWLKQKKGRICRVPYPSNWGDAVCVQFEASFEEAETLFELPAFRRALLAYLYDALLRMRDRQTRSLFARFHNYDATSEIFRHLAEVNAFRSRLTK